MPNEQENNLVPESYLDLTEPQDSMDIGLSDFLPSQKDFDDALGSFDLDLCEVLP